MAPDTPGYYIRAAAETDGRHALEAFAAHIRDTGWDENCPACVSLQAHVDRTEAQVALVSAGEPEEVPLW
jgi:hypothetical protein